MTPELPYAVPLALLTDLYQLTMAQGYLHHGKAEQDAVFHLYFRKPPFGSGYTIAAGIGPAIAWLTSFALGPDDRDYLASLHGNDGGPLFSLDFIDWLAALRLTLDVDAVPEGTVVYANEPLLRIRGPLAQCQLVETALLSIVNFQTLIATKAARVCYAAEGGPVLEFGLRRAQGIDGGLSATRAAFIGGAAATSNVLAGRIYGIPVRGTHAHSWVMSFPSEGEAFDRYADALPNNATLLVDTYDTIQGVHNAIRTGERLRARGHRLAGIRLDSGDLAALSIAARELLDAAGFTDAVIVASNDLDERLIESLRHQGARIDVWGVGTRLATGGDQCALGGVYKLAALRTGPHEPWAWKVKLSENPAKVTTPGILQVRRWSEGDYDVADALWNTESMPASWSMVDQDDPMHTLLPKPGWTWRDLLVPAVRGGVRVSPPEPLELVRTRVRANVARLRPTQLRFDNPQRYPVGLESGLWNMKRELVAAARRQEAECAR
jgi:nicotinate phosphoribosyltransferase